MVDIGSDMSVQNLVATSIKSCCFLFLNVQIHQECLRSKQAAADLALIRLQSAPSAVVPQLIELHGTPLPISPF